MTPDQAIQLELLLIVVALVAFWIWQTVACGAMGGNCRRGGRRSGGRGRPGATMR